MVSFLNLTRPVLDLLLGARSLFFGLESSAPACSQAPLSTKIAGTASAVRRQSLIMDLGSIAASP